MDINRRQAIKMITGAVPAVAGAGARALAAVPKAGATPSAVGAPQATAMPSSAGAVRRFVFDGVSSEMQLTMAELGQPSPADLAGYTHLVMEMRTSSHLHRSEEHTSELQSLRH